MVMDYIISTKNSIEGCEERINRCIQRGLIHSKNPTCMHSIHVINIVLFLQSAVVDRDIITTFYQTG